MERAGRADGDAAYAVLDLAMRAGDLLLSAGMSARDVVATMRGIARSYGLAEVQVDVTYTTISASYHPAPEVPPVAYTRVVRPGDVDYSRIRSLITLCGEMEKGLPFADAQAEFEWIWLPGHRYPVWVATAGNAGVGAGVVLLFTTSWPVIVVTFVMGCLVDRMLAWLVSKGVPPFFRQFAGAVLVTMIAAGIAKAGADGLGFAAEINPTLLVTGGIVMLVVGAVIVGAAQDAIDQFYVTASARVFEVAMRTTGIVLGIVAAIRLASLLNLPLPVSAHPVSHGPLAGQFAGATLAAAFFALYAYSDLVTIAFAAAAGFVGWGIYALFLNVGGGEAAASAAGAMVAALAATIVTRRTHVPAFGLISAAILPLVPGLSLYDGLLQVIGTPARSTAPALGAATLLAALGTALSIAAGTSLGTFLGRPLVDRVRRVRRPRRSGRRDLPLAE
ncbi:MAG TPA: threonine/serine exporter family protein [Streptosporangiaceae bacterium]|nr:threonine/serine exporter family protein [Streptosporangiaceae bacterium]